MLHQEVNDYGVLSVDDSFVNQMLKDSIKKYEGKAWIAKYQGKHHDFIIKLGNIDSLFDKEVHESDRGVFLKTYIMVRFGTSIGSVANGIIDYTAEIIEKDLGLKIDDIQVCLTGVMTGKGNVKRDIIYSYNNNHNIDQ